MKNNPYKIRTGWVTCIKKFNLDEDSFIKGRIYKFCFDDSTVYCPNSHIYKFVGLLYPEVFRKFKVFDIFNRNTKLK